MKILINKTKRLLFVGKLMLKPGTNIVDDNFDTEDNNVKAWVKAKMLSVKDSSKMDEEAIEDERLVAARDGLYLPFPDGLYGGLVGDGYGNKAV